MADAGETTIAAKTAEVLGKAPTMSEAAGGIVQRGGASPRQKSRRAGDDRLYNLSRAVIKS